MNYGMKPPPPVDRLVFFATSAHECSYLPDREATTVFADPSYPKDARLYTVLSQHGFRRSGQHIYRPRCDACQACVPVRVPVRQFSARRSQRRALNANRDLRVAAKPPAFHWEHFALYRRYLGHRHAGGGMDNPTPKQYLDFLTSPWSDTTFYEFRCGNELLAVSVLDRLMNALSAVYTFFEPEQPGRSLGVYTILWSIEEARRQAMEWLYLGYWVNGSRKMRYKREYQPQEHFRGGRWSLAENL